MCILQFGKGTSWIITDRGRTNLKATNTGFWTDIEAAFISFCSSQQTISRSTQIHVWKTLIR